MKGSLYQANNFGQVNENVLTLCKDDCMGWRYLVGCFNEWESEEEIGHYSIGIQPFDNACLSPYIGYCGVRRWCYVEPEESEG